MKVGLIGDIVGKHARTLLSTLLPKIKIEYQLDFIIANAENASHGFGLNLEHSHLLFASGVDVLTGGNHSFDKNDSIYSHSAILRPHNLSPLLAGSGIFETEVQGEKLAVLNLMGHFGMPQCQNAFLCAKDCVENLHSREFKNIIIDFHAEATSEKRILFEMLKGKVSAIFGTHTHIGTDDLMIENGSFYVSDIGMCGAFDSVIGMDCKAPIQRALSGLNQARLEVSQSQKTILQMIILHLQEGKAIKAQKIRYIHTLGWLPNLEAIQL